jgi:hypothetical protein
MVKPYDDPRSARRRGDGERLRAAHPGAPCTLDLRRYPIDRPPPRPEPEEPLRFLLDSHPGS